MPFSRMLTWICCLCLCAGAARADEARTPRMPAAGGAVLSAQIRLPGGNPVDPIAALGRTWDERELRTLLSAFGIKDKPTVKRGDITGFLQNRRRGIELTFRDAEALDVPTRQHPPGTVVLSSIRLYGPGSRTHAPFKGSLPFGLRFGDSKADLVAKLGPPDVDGSNVPPMRWDTARYALFAQLDETGRLDRLSLQVPYVASSRPGFEARP